MRSIAGSTRVALVSGVSLIGLLAAGQALAQATTNNPAGQAKPPSAPAVASGRGAMAGGGGGAAPGTAPNTGSRSYNELDEIIVTAQRQSQSLQDVPIAISAFTAQALQAKQINNSSDLQLSLPNVTFTKTNFTTSSFTIRGVGDLCVGGTCDSATAIHTNDLPLFSTRLFETEFFDLERIEVLRGPQGTLFGRNATSGVVNVISAKPDLRALHASVDGEYGNYNAYKIKGMINVPLTDTLGIRVAGYYLDRKGYTKDVYDDSRIDGRKSYGGRASLRWKPDDRTTIDLVGFYFREKDNRLRIQKQLCQRDPTGVLGCLPGKLDNGVSNFNSTFVGTLSSREFLTTQGGPAIGALGLGSLYGADAFAGAVNPADPRKVSTAYKPTYFADEIQASARIEHDFGAVKLVASGLYQRNRVDSSQDYYLAVQNPAGFAQGLGTLAAFGAGAGGAALSQFGQPAKVLTPNGPGGPYCTSLPEETGTGAYGGHAICSSVPLNFDRSTAVNQGYTGEAILSSQFDGKFNFLLGGIYNRFTTKNLDYYVNGFGIDYVAGVLGTATALGQQGAQAAAGQPVTFPNVYLGSPFYRNNQQDYRLDSYGVFGEGYYDVTDKVKLTVGLRYNNDKKEVTARTALAAFPVPYGTANAFNSPFVGAFDADPGIAGNQLFQFRKVSFGEFTGRAVLDWKISDENLIYISYSRGYKSGGINPPLSPIFSVPETFTPEFIDSFEIGSKNTFLDGRLRLNLAGFYYKYKGLQLARIVARTAVNDNVDANIYGVEADAIVAPIPPLEFNFGFSYLHTKVSKDKFLSNPRDPSGGRGDAVIIKDITNGSNCAVVPNAVGNGALANGFVAGVNNAINAGAIPGLKAGAGLRAPTAFPTNSGLNPTTTGAFSICAALAGTAAATGTPVTILNEGVSVNMKGNQLPQAPEFKVSAGAQFTANLGGDLTLVPRFDIDFTGNSYGSIFNGSGPGQTASINRIPSFYIMNAQIQLNGRDARWYVRGFIQNLSNNNAVTGQYVTDQSSGLFTNVFTLEPRRYGVGAGIKF